MDQVVYNGDERYPGPTAHGPPAEIKGIPSQGEIDAFPRMFTWGELKEVVRELFFAMSDESGWWK